MLALDRCAEQPVPSRVRDDIVCQPIRCIAGDRYIFKIGIHRLEQIFTVPPVDLLASVFFGIAFQPRKERLGSNDMIFRFSAVRPKEIAERIYEMRVTAFVVIAPRTHPPIRIIGIIAAVGRHLGIVAQPFCRHCCNDAVFERVLRIVLSRPAVYVFPEQWLKRIVDLPVPRHEHGCSISIEPRCVDGAHLPVCFDEFIRNGKIDRLQYVARDAVTVGAFGIVIRTFDVERQRFFLLGITGERTLCFRIAAISLCKAGKDVLRTDIETACPRFALGQELQLSDMVPPFIAFDGSEDCRSLLVGKTDAKLIEQPLIVAFLATGKKDKRHFFK